jgi:cleavage and polyadenylation specificity factor subunit 4
LLSPSLSLCSALSFDFDEEFAKEAPGYYFPTKVPGAQYKVCQLFQKNQCFKGDRCPYRHINERQVLCKHWLRGLCKRGDNCIYAHEYDLNRMQECQFFKNEGQCNNPDCLWKHVTPEDKERAAECLAYQRGFCRHGPKCRNKHVKKALCLNYLAGFCPQGPACEKAHAAPEILTLMDGTLRVRCTEVPVCLLCAGDGHTMQNCTQQQQQQQQPQQQPQQHQQHHHHQQHHQQQQPYFRQ